MFGTAAQSSYLPSLDLLIRQHLEQPAPCAPAAEGRALEQASCFLQGEGPACAKSYVLEGSCDG